MSNSVLSACRDTIEKDHPNVKRKKIWVYIVEFSSTRFRMSKAEGKWVVTEKGKLKCGECKTRFEVLWWLNLFHIFLRDALSHKNL